MDRFKLVSKFKPTGDQPQAIKKLIQRIKSEKRFSTLLGVTGSGKTFTLACAIEKLNRPVLVISHNKTLASQLYAEFREFFPQNAVEYFVSYYDYYQPESYIPQTDTYIEKDASINDRLDRLRLSSTSSLIARQDVIVVASVSCIYNLGSPEDYQNLTLNLVSGQALQTESVIKQLTELQYERNDFDFQRGTFRLKGDTLDIFPSYKERPLRVEFFNQELEKIYEFDQASGKKISDLERVSIYPAKHFIIEKDKIEAASRTISLELEDRCDFFKKEGKLLEAQRLRQRTLFDLEMLNECGYCHGIENYSRHLTGRPTGSRPFCLLDYFSKDFITIIDESHVTVPQVRGMYEGDKSRKKTLVNYGFRLPSCLDNRPLRFDEFTKLINKAVHVSATPAEYELKLSDYKVVEQIIRPTGLPDPEIEVRPSENQIEDIIAEVKNRIKSKERTLITTLTKRMAEELSRYLADEGLKVSYVHSEVNTFERTKILKDLRMKKIDLLVGVNLLREGLDLPEVSLVIILDADKEGFLRSATSLIQVAGRCARNINGHVIMYADRVTKSMQKAINESSRRRKVQLEHNRINNITPRSIQKAINEGIEIYLKEANKLNQRLDLKEEVGSLHEVIGQLEKEMFLAAKHLHFEKAASLRDKIEELRKVIAKKVK
ncbi:MAG: excinuclease ABC subunit UvrB [Candidatus Omnitrophica bacterium]|nr:excinuclease ABC subunit UvrB [Candidatus Omnitrophota bacterium]